jgi:hypothetical protein
MSASFHYYISLLTDNDHLISPLVIVPSSERGEKKRKEKKRKEGHEMQDT